MKEFIEEMFLILSAIFGVLILSYKWVAVGTPLWFAIGFFSCLISVFFLIKNEVKT